MKELIKLVILIGVLTAAGAAHAQPANAIANGDFTTNAAAFTVPPGAINGGNPAGIANWQVFGAGSGVGLNGARTGAGNSFGPTSPGGRTYAFIQSAQTLLGQYLTLAPNTQYKLDYDVAARAGNTAQYRVVVSPSDSAGFNGLYYDSGVQPGNNAAFAHVTAYFTTPAALGASPNIQLWNVTGSGDNTIAYANVTLRLANPPCTFDDFNGGNDTGWTHYAPVNPSYFLFPTAWGSGAYQLWSPAGDSSNPGRIGSYRMDEPIRTNFHVEADLVNWSENKGQYMGVMARVQSVPTDGTFPGGYALVLRVSATGYRWDDKLLIQKINTGTTQPTDLSGANDQGYNISNGIIYPAPGSNVYRLVFWSEGIFLKGQVIEKSTGAPLMFYDGFGNMTNVLWATDPGSTYASGRSGLFSYVRIVASTAQGVDPTFDNFYSGTNAPDTTPPGITCPTNRTVSADSGQCYATGVALGTPVTSDNSGGSVTVWNNAPAQFNQGVTTVTWNASDASGNTASCAQTVTVNDTQPPSITCPADVTISANAGCTATNVALGSLTTGDNCGVASVTNNAPASYPPGTNAVTWTVTDSSGNTATGTQRVVVRDTTAPTITPPADVTISANTGCAATNVVLGIPSTGDNCSVASVTNDAPVSYPLGTNVITWAVTDGSGNMATGTQRVVVRDTTAPTITSPADVTISANAGCAATNVALGIPITGDNCSVASVTNNAPVSYPLGTNIVTWTVTDGSGNKATGTQRVIVRDTTLPTITCPADVTVSANAGCTANNVALGVPVTADNCTVASIGNNAPATYPLGTNVVTWTVRDASGNKATCTQRVVVRDTTPPTITCPANVTVSANAGGTATNVALGIPVTADNCSVASVRNNAPTAYPAGTNIVTWTVTDGSGNTATGVQTVTVVLSSPGNPSISYHGGKVTISWASGVLQQADDVRGIYTDLPGAASPYTNAVLQSQKFYRSRSPGP